MARFVDINTIKNLQPRNETDNFRNNLLKAKIDMLLV